MTIHLLASFANPLGLIALIAAVPIVLLFLLKRRYRDQEVSSALLWSRLMEDVLARAPFRRPTEWLSLALLLLAVLALGFAIAELRLGAERPAGMSFLVVLDGSASMETIAESGSRFEQAREGVEDLIDGMESGDDLTLIVVGPGDPSVLCHRLEDPAVAGSLLDGVAVSAVDGDLPSAITYAVDAARVVHDEGGLAEMLVFSDFAGDRARLEALDTAGVPILLVQCGEDRPNAGIVHVALTGSSDRGRLLVTMAARGGADDNLERSVALFRDDVLVDARDVVLSPDGSERSVVFEIAEPGRSSSGTEDRSASYSVRLEPGDAMAIDDVAYLGISPSTQPVLLHVGKDDPFVRGLARTFPGLEVRTARAEDALSAISDLTRPVDLVIATEPLLAPAPALRELHLGVAPPELDGRLGPRAVHPVVMRWERMDPILRGVGLEGLQVVACRSFEGPGQTLVETTAGAQMARVDQADRDVFVWSSAVGESNLVLLPAFPLLIRNLLGSGLGGVRADLLTARAGLRVSAGASRYRGQVEVNARAPDGEEQGGSFLGGEDFFWSGAVSPGLYTIETTASSGDDYVRYVGMNLLSKAESTAAIEVPDPSAFALTGDAEPVQLTNAASLNMESPIWRGLVVAAVCALMLELLVWSEAWRRLVEWRGARADRPRSSTQSSKVAGSWSERR